MLVCLYATGVPLFTFLSWIYLDAFSTGNAPDRGFRGPIALLAGAVWPVLLVGVAYLRISAIRAKFLEATIEP